jgi:hypothetical protein
MREEEIHRRWFPRRQDDLSQVALLRLALAIVLFMLVLCFGLLPELFGGK